MQWPHVKPDIGQLELNHPPPVLYRDNSEQWCASPVGAHIASPVGANIAPGGVGGSEPLAVLVEATQEARLAAAREVEHLLRG